MTTTNHALTGAVIGLMVGEPLIAIPAAIVSHFVCDAIPHYDKGLPGNRWLRTKSFRNYLLITSLLCVLLVVALAIFQPEHWFLASVCAFAATAPDLLWLNRYLKVRRGKHWKRGAFMKFAGDIQWFAKPIGAVVEIAWAIAAVLLILPFFR